MYMFWISLRYIMAIAASGIWDHNFGSYVDLVSLGSRLAIAAMRLGIGLNS